MIRPILAFLTLCVAAFVLAPTVASVHEKVDRMNVQRETPWQIFKWIREPNPPPIGRPDCKYEERHLVSEVDDWPERIRKSENFTLGGSVKVEEEDLRPIYDVKVDLFLNETKEEPGIHIATLTTGLDGRFVVQTSLPFDSPATNYHIVAHAHEKLVGCKRFLEHWSDPEMQVVSRTTIVWDAVEHAVVTRPFDLSGTVYDVVRAPVRNVTVDVTLDGKTVPVTTDGNGRFLLNHTAPTAGERTARAAWKGDEYYEASAAETRFSVKPEDVDLDEPITILRSTETPVRGRVYLPADVASGPITLTFHGFEAATCAECDAASTAQVTPDADGAFVATLVVPATQTPGPVSIAVSGGGLKRTYDANASLIATTRIALVVEGTGLFRKDYRANVTLTDEAGVPLEADVGILGPDGWRGGRTDGDGVLLVSAKAPCGSHDLTAVYNGTQYLQPATAVQTARVCGILAFIPPWLLAVPWWVWPLVALAAWIGWTIYRGARQRYAPILTSGPPLTVAFTEPTDAAAGYASVGERIVATAFLEAPLPDGHSLRMGVARAMEERPLDADLRAHWEVVPTKLGELPVRAEIVDAKGRVVTRRTMPLRVVQYAEEIERRYLALRKGTGATEDVTPREFEAWLRKRAPMLDAGVARRLVRIFEEADYSPRAAGRADFSAYLEAEAGVQEVAQDAALA